MKNYTELNSSDLKKEIDFDLLNFKTTRDIEPVNDLIGQERGARAIKFGLNIKEKDYNIYVTGESGTGKTTYTKKYTREQAKNDPTPDDLLYVYNFSNENEPTLLKVQAGKGKIFKDELDETVNILSEELPKAFADKSLSEKKDLIVRKNNEQKDILLAELEEYAKIEGFSVDINEDGIFISPTKRGKKISDKDYEKLSPQEKLEITRKGNYINEKVIKILEEVDSLNNLQEEKIKEIDFSAALFVVGRSFQTIIEKYCHLEKIHKFILDCKEDILENIDLFVEKPQDENEEENPLLSLLTLPKKERDLEKYSVNLYVDNSNLVGAPVIIEYNPTYNNLFGSVEYLSEGTSLATSFMKIKNGCIQRARGGYLIISADDLVNNPETYYGLKRCLRSGEVSIETSKEYALGATIATLTPEKVDFKTKIILIGKRDLYDILSYNDEDFIKYFKICSIFDYEMNFEIENCKLISSFVKIFVTNHKSKDFTLDAVKEIIFYASRIAENQNKLSIKFNEISKLLIESNAYAGIDNSEFVEKKHIQEALENKESRMCIYEDKLDELMENDIIMINTTDSIVGQINGLAVLNTGEYEFGKPSKITVTTYSGKKGVVNIEKEADLSGSIHDKGIHVLTGYMGETFAKEIPLSFSCNICFEQNYSGIDGDSASSTELYGLLSSLSNVPIKQYIAVTGSVNQKGEIQPIGGATYKIEGFHKLCKKRGLTGKEGVIIPHTNIKDLVLKDEVIEDIKNGLFHIYPVKHIDEGIEILTDIRANNGDNTIYHRVYKTLKNYYEISEKLSK
ncbi:MAG: AAA family ATPase [Lachnospirales bacterium]